MIKPIILLLCTILIISCNFEPLNVVKLTSSPLYSATLSQDGTYAILSSADDGLNYWDLIENKPIYRWFHETQHNQVIHAAISANTQYAITLSHHSVAMWQLDTGKSMGIWSLSAKGQQVAIANNGAFLVGLSDGSVMFMSQTQQKLIKFLGHQEKVNAVAISNDGKLALTGGNDHQVILWNTHTGQIKQQWQLDTRIMAIALSDDKQYSFANDSSNQGIIWRNGNGSKLSELNINVRTQIFSYVQFINQGKQLMTGTSRQNIMLWRTKDGKKIAQWKVQATKNSKFKGAVVYSLAHKQPNQLLSISSNGLLETWALPPL